MTAGLGPMNTVVTGNDANTRMVRQTRLDALPGADEARMIKLDVEGHEENVLRGASACSPDQTCRRSRSRP